MSFGENLQESRSHHALLRLQETEIKLLENIRNCVKLRIKSDQDYAKSLQTIIVQSQKFENPEFTGPTFDVWNKVVKETGNLIKQIQSCSDNLQKETFEKLTILINERKASKKSFSDERCRLDSEVKKLQDTVQRNKDEYSKVVGRVREERVKYEALFEKGKAGGKFEDAKTKYLKAEGKLHTAHNDYILSLHELELYQQQYLTTLLPGFLNFQETVQQSNIAQTKDILIEYGKLTDSTAEEFACIHKEIKTELEKIDPSTEYNHFIDGNKSDPLTIDALVFDENLLEDYRGNIIPAQLAFNDLSHEAMLRKRTLFEDKLAQAEADTKVYEDELEGIQGEIADLVNQSTEDNNMKKNDLNVKRRAEDILQRKIGQLKCSIERFRSLYDYANAEIEKAGEELPKGLDLPDLNSDASPTQDVSDASVAGGSSGLKGTLHKLKNKMTKKPPAMPTPLPSKDKLHARHSVAASEEGDTMENRPPPPLPVEEKEVSIVNESRDAEVTNEIDTTTNNHIELRHSVVIPDGTSLLMTTDITRSVTEEDWFHGVLPREEVQKLLEVDGDYLVRESKNKQTGQMQYVLSMRSKGAPKHFIIQGQDGSWRFEGQTFPTIQELIIHQHQSGKPVTSRTQAILERPVLREEWELKNDDIKVIKKIGNGNFGDVFKGTYAGEEVAIKTCKDTLSDEQKKKFLMEGRILKQYDHPNIVRFIGIATHKQPIMIVMEYMAGGSLLTHLRRVGDSLQTQQLIRFCEDAASGMAYLEQKCCIHRDLAARNCLIAKPSNDIKISDFGMSREEEEYTVSDGLKQIPIKWTAPEALNYGKYTSMCDIWSYGILMWEIFSGGKTPYQGWNNTKSREMVEDGYRLPNPEGCPELIYALMLKAWEYDPDKRPHFDQIYRELQSIRNRLC